MQVVIIGDFAEVNGGAAKVAVASARGIAERGVRVTYLHGMPAVDDSLRHPNITPVCLGLTNVWDERPLKAALQAVWNLEVERRISVILKRFDRSDTVVHFHQWTKALSPSAIRAVARAGFHHVITMHDYALGCPNGAYFNYARIAPCNLEPMSLACMTTQCDVRGRAHTLAGEDGNAYRRVLKKSLPLRTSPHRDCHEIKTLKSFDIPRAIRRGKGSNTSGRRAASNEFLIIQRALDHRAAKCRIGIWRRIKVDS